MPRALLVVMVVGVLGSVLTREPPGYIKLKDFMKVIEGKADIDGEDALVSIKYGQLRGRRREGYPQAGKNVNS